MSVILQRYLYLVLLSAIVFTGFATLLANEVEIQLLNSVRLSLAIGVLFAYSPTVFHIVHDPKPLEKEDYLAFGIFYSWLGQAGSGIWWIAFQLAGRPAVWANTDWVAGTIFLGCIGALLHFAAPAAIDGRVPPRRQLKIGALVAVGMLGSLLIFDAAAIQMRVQEYAHPHSPGSLKEAPEFKAQAL